MFKSVLRLTEVNLLVIHNSYHNYYDLHNTSACIACQEKTSEKEQCLSEAEEMEYWSSILLNTDTYYNA